MDFASAAGCSSHQYLAPTKFEQPQSCVNGAIIPGASRQPAGGGQAYQPDNNNVSSDPRILDQDHFTVPLAKKPKVNVTVLEAAPILPELSDDEDDEGFDGESDGDSSDSDTTIGFGSHVSFASSREKAIGTASLLLQLTKGPKPDDFLFCDECNDWEEDLCMEHPTKHIENSEIRNSHGVPGLPAQFTVSTSNVDPEKQGVFALEEIGQGYLLGPLEGPHKYDFPALSIEEVDYLWEVKLFSGQSQYMLMEEMGDKQQTPKNWLYLVGFCGTASQQNVFAMQYKGEIYYKTMRHIRVAEEILVFNGCGLGMMKDVVPREEVVLGLRADGAALTRQCAHCPFVYAARAELSAHMKGGRHKPVDDIKCRKCQFVGETRSQLRAHMSSKHMERPYKCVICPYHKGCVSSAGLKKHMQTKHTGDTGGQNKKHACQVCGKQFARKHHWRNHLASHGSASFACKLCAEKYRTEVTLRNHMATAHDIGQKYEQPRKQCPHCEFSTPQKSVLMQHIQSRHTNTKTETMETPRVEGVKKKIFRCNYCDDVFTCQSAVPRHEWRKHALEKAEDTAKKNNSMTSRGFQCSKCAKSFKTVSDLNYHMMRHNGQFPHTCHLCPKGYPNGAELRKHIARTHKETKIEG